MSILLLLHDRKLDEDGVERAPADVMMEWETREVAATMLLHIAAADAPVVCEQYAKEQGLPNTPGWNSSNGLDSSKRKYSLGW